MARETNSGKIIRGKTIRGKKEIIHRIIGSLREIMTSKSYTFKGANTSKNRGRGGGGRGGGDGGGEASGIHQKMDYVPAGGEVEKIQTTIDDHDGFNATEKYKEQMTTTNYLTGSNVLEWGWAIVNTITREFHKDEQLHPPMFLWHMYGTYFTRSIYFVEWVAEQTHFWINDTKEPMAKWRMTDGQRNLRFAMLKEFQKRMQATLRSEGFPVIEVLYSPEVAWPKKTRLI